MQLLSYLACNAYIYILIQHTDIECWLPCSSFCALGRDKSLKSYIHPLPSGNSDFWWSNSQASEIIIIAKVVEHMPYAKYFSVPFIFYCLSSSQHPCIVNNIYRKSTASKEDHEANLCKDPALTVCYLTPKPTPTTFI